MRRWLTALLFAALTITTAHAQSAAPPARIGFIAYNNEAGAAPCGVLRYRFQRLQSADQLPGLNSRNDADLPATANIQPRPIRIEVCIEFFEKQRIHSLLLETRFRERESTLPPAVSLSATDW